MRYPEFAAGVGKFVAEAGCPLTVRGEGHFPGLELSLGGTGQRQSAGGLWTPDPFIAVVSTNEPVPVERKHHIIVASSHRYRDEDGRYWEAMDGSVEPAIDGQACLLVAAAGLLRVAYADDRPNALTAQVGTGPEIQVMPGVFCSVPAPLRRVPEHAN